MNHQREDGWHSEVSSIDGDEEAVSTDAEIVSGNQILFCTTRRGQKMVSKVSEASTKCENELRATRGSGTLPLPRKTSQNLSATFQNVPCPFHRKRRDKL